MQNIKKGNANNFCSWAVSTCNINRDLLATVTAGNTFFLYQSDINVEFPPLETSLEQLYDVLNIFKMFLPHTNVLRCNVKIISTRNPNVEIPDHFFIYTIHEQDLPIFILKPTLEPNLYSLTEEIYFIADAPSSSSSNYKK